MGVKVLVVEDDPGVRESTCEVLESAGFEADSAADGIEALAKVDADVGALVLDLFMPKLDGIGVLEQLDDTVTVVVVSAFEYRTREEVERRCAGRVCAFLYKPVPPPTLVRTLADCVAGKA